ncbi:hypothetical protein BpHYR1_021974 [Brachionus plicatilis]|uniref:Uncharacterized protein n=1 Tax=Brachionus plicatilis TaxID=10195 RepID=A0A3M7PFW7_BRAPC|nr:hypothetical protein BpHYR1_021974 [Brachionus plicatilis]
MHNLYIRSELLLKKVLEKEMSTYPILTLKAGSKLTPVILVELVPLGSSKRLLLNMIGMLLFDVIMTKKLEEKLALTNKFKFM